MSERQIIFSGQMVRAILDGRKTQTRRLLLAPWKGRWKKPPVGDEFLEEDGRLLVRCEDDEQFHEASEVLPSPHGEVGGRLLVRETFGFRGYGNTGDWRPRNARMKEDDLDRWAIEYRADWGPNQEGCIWRSPRFMPRWASRITLEITEVRVQRLQDISAEDVEAEGISEEETRCDGECGETPCSLLVPTYARAWNSINAKRAPWATNPWVWAITFKRVGV